VRIAPLESCACTTFRLLHQHHSSNKSPAITKCNSIQYTPYRTPHANRLDPQFSRIFSVPLHHPCNQHFLSLSSSFSQLTRHPRHHRVISILNRRITRTVSRCIYRKAERSLNLTICRYTVFPFIPCFADFPFHFQGCGVLVPHLPLPKRSLFQLSVTSSLAISILHMQFLNCARVVSLFLPLVSKWSFSSVQLVASSPSFYFYFHTYRINCTFSGSPFPVALALLLPSYPFSHLAFALTLFFFFTYPFLFNTPPVNSPPLS